MLIKHLLFTFGDNAKESYERHVNLVTLAETGWPRRVATAGAHPFVFYAA